MKRAIHIHIHRATRDISSKSPLSDPWAPYGIKDDWSPEARAAAAEARKQHAHHTAQQEYHGAEAAARGENRAKPAIGSHAAASSMHGSAAFNHGKLAEAHEAGNHADVQHYEKLAKKTGSAANGQSKKIASGKGAYPTEKQNSFEPKTESAQAGFARRAQRYLAEKRVGPRR